MADAAVLRAAIVFCSRHQPHMKARALLGLCDRCRPGEVEVDSSEVRSSLMALVVAASASVGASVPSMSALAGWGIVVLRDLKAAGVDVLDVDSFTEGLCREGSAAYILLQRRQRKRDSKTGNSLSQRISGALKLMLRRSKDLQERCGCRRKSGCKKVGSGHSLGTQATMGASAAGFCSAAPPRLDTSAKQNSGRSLGAQTACLLQGRSKAPCEREAIRKFRETRPAFVRDRETSRVGLSASCHDRLDLNKGESLVQRKKMCSQSCHGSISSNLVVPGDPFDDALGFSRSAPE